jgi:hypothetical protein
MHALVVSALGIARGWVRKTSNSCRATVKHKVSKRTLYAGLSKTAAIGNRDEGPQQIGIEQRSIGFGTGRHLIISFPTVSCHF